MDSQTCIRAGAHKEVAGTAMTSSEIAEPSLRRDHALTGRAHGPDRFCGGLGRRAPAVILSALVFLVAFASSPAEAFCSKPVSPHCAADGTLSDSYVSTSDCRNRVQEHVEALERFSDCLQDLVDETNSEIIELKELVRGESPDTPT